MRINGNTILNYINNPQLFEDKEKEEIRNELARQGIQQENEKQYYIKEIKRLNNIINELEKWLEDYHNNTGLSEYETGIDDAICDTLKKIKALKGDSSNE